MIFQVNDIQMTFLNKQKLIYLFTMISRSYPTLFILYDINNFLVYGKEV